MYSPGCGRLTEDGIQRILLVSVFFVSYVCYNFIKNGFYYSIVNEGRLKMWPLSIWNRAREQRKALQDKLWRLKVEEMKLSYEWDKMLIRRNHVTVLCSETEEGLSLKYEEFQKLRSEKKRLGSIDSIKDKRSSFDSGTFYLFVYYCEFDLITGYSLREYNEAIRRYDGISEEIVRLQEQLDKKQGFFQRFS